MYPFLQKKATGIRWLLVGVVPELFFDYALNNSLVVHHKFNQVGSSRNVTYIYCIVFYFTFSDYLAQNSINTVVGRGC